MHSDKEPPTGRPNPLHLNLDDEREVIATAKAFCVTPQELRAAVATAGTDIAALQAFGAPVPPSTVDTGQQKQLSIVAGSNFADGKGNATAYFEYFNAGAAVGYQFDHAACTLIGGATPNTPITCGGSGTSPHTHVEELGGGA